MSKIYKLRKPPNKSKKYIENFFISKGLKLLVDLSRNKARSVNEMITKDPFIPELRDLYNLYQYVAINKRITLLEFGSGWSTLIFSLALKELKDKFSKIGGRFLSMPGYSKKILSDKAILANFKEHDKITKKISKILTLGKKCKIFSEDGTNLECNLSGRLANSCPGHVMEKGSLGSPPDVEANISPIENQSNGFLTINGSIANEEIGLLNKPVYLIIKNGKIAQIKSDSKKINNLLKKTFYKFGPKSKVLAEIGIGLNKKAKLTGHMLTDEGSYGCIHFGFGSNFSVGGKNKVDFHLDFITKKHSLYIDEKLIIKKGKIVI